MCLYSRVIRNPKYKPNKKNGGLVPPVLDERVLFIAIGCGDCIECRKQKARAWQARLLEDIRTHQNGKMVTLTFSNESIAELYQRVMEDETKRRIEWYEAQRSDDRKITTIPYREKNPYEIDNAIAKKGVRMWLERHRKKYGTSIRHWLVTELGHQGTENIHLHGIIWTDKPMAAIEERWGYGFMWKGYKRLGQLINYVNAKTVNYTVKYVNKIDKDHRSYKSIVLTSPGIGADYVKRQDAKRNRYVGVETNEAYLTPTGHQIAMPIY